METLTRHSDLLVPLESVITRADGQKEVMVVVNNRIARRTVNTGIGDREKVEITGGLQAGDVLIRDGSQALPDKARVKPEKR